MTASRQTPRRRMPASAKQLLFIVAALLGAFHLFGLAVLVFARDAEPLLAALFLDVMAAVFAVAWWGAERLFRGEEDR